MSPVPRTGWIFDLTTKNIFRRNGKKVRGQERDPHTVPTGHPFVPGAKSGLRGWKDGSSPYYPPCKGVPCLFPRKTCGVCPLLVGQLSQTARPKGEGGKKTTLRRRVWAAAKPPGPPGPLELRACSPEGPREDPTPSPESHTTRVRKRLEL